MPDLTTREAQLEKIVSNLQTIEENTRGGGGGGYTRTQLYGEWKSDDIELLDDITNYDEIEFEVGSTQYSTYICYNRFPVDRMVNSGKDFVVATFGITQFFNFGITDATHFDL